MCTCGLNLCARVGEDTRYDLDEVLKHPTWTPRIYNPHFPSRWWRWVDVGVLGRENASQIGPEASRRRRKAGAMVLRRESASKNGAEAGQAMSTSMSTWSTSMSTKSGTRQAKMRRWCSGAMAATNEHGGGAPQQTQNQRGGSWLEFWCTCDYWSLVRARPAGYLLAQHNGFGGKTVRGHSRGGGDDA